MTEIVQNLLDALAHQAINVELIVARGLEQFLVACKIIEEDCAVIDHTRERIIDDGDLDTVRQQLDDLAF